MHGVTGQRPISVRWVVHNKDDNQHPNVRARLVARRIREKYGGKDVDDLFAAMPPFEVVKLLLAKCVQSQHAGNRRTLISIDISRTCMHLWTLESKRMSTFHRNARSREFAVG